MRQLELGKQFRPGTSHVYPPFKNGRYMEEYCYEYFNTVPDKSQYVYIPVFWTNLQNHPGFSKMRNSYNILLQNALKKYPIDQKYITIVQHDDGPLLDLPLNTVVYGACTGTIPLPLIYEDVSQRLLTTPRTSEKDIIASFVGTYTTHTVRGEMFTELYKKDGIVCHVKELWSHIVEEDDATRFIDLTLRSKFCLAPRGYGRSSFRFFEAMQLGTIPVYIWDDIEWLPYKNVVDYSKFAISIHKSNMHNLYDILLSISDEKYDSMLKEMYRVMYYFTLEGMCEMISKDIE